MPDGGTLTFATSNIRLNGRDPQGVSGVDRPDYVVVEVTDTGTGIPEAFRDKIFDPFFSTKESGQGTGLGLSMVFGFVKQSGGNIEVQSEEGHGTTFRIYLPKADIEVSQLPSADNLQATGGTETILCVEDDAIIRDGRILRDVFFLSKPYRRPQLARMVRRSLDAPPVAFVQGQPKTA